MSSATTSTGTRIRTWLMTGVSYMIPFVAAGGILIALGFLLGTAALGGDPDKGGIRIYDAAIAGVDPAGFNYGSLANWAFIIFWLGKAAFAFFVPVLAGYIAFAIADRPGLAPGFVAGALATGLGVDGTLNTGTGFLGAILGGALAGGLALWISRWSVPSWVRPLMPVVIIPLLASLVTGLGMIIVLKAPVGWLVNALNGGLASLSTAGLVVVGLVLGLMMAFDMGGPVNKVAYTFATTGLAAGLELAAKGTAVGDVPQFKIMAIVMAAGMVPPIGMALATVLNKKLYDDAERENGKAGWLLGASFISEGAIPFAAADPTRVIPSIMVGSAVTGGLVGFFGNAIPAPHGGIFVFPLVTNVLTYVVAILIGAAVTAFMVNFLKGMKK
jgi:PTS system fructose-specific IIC component